MKAKEYAEKYQDQFNSEELVVGALRDLAVELKEESVSITKSRYKVQGIHPSVVREIRDKSQAIAKEIEKLGCAYAPVREWFDMFYPDTTKKVVSLHRAETLFSRARSDRQVVRQSTDEARDIYLGMAK